MAHKSDFSHLVTRLRTSRQGSSGFRALLGELSPGSSLTSHMTRLPSSRDARTGEEHGHAIDFGSSAGVRARHGTEGTNLNWGSLVRHVASGGVSNAFGGGLLGAVGGLGGLVGKLVGLFRGGKKEPPPLTLFRLPDREERALTIDTRVNGGTQTPIYGTPPAPVAASTAQHDYRYQSTQIAQAVKQALLTTNSLNDVLAEL